MPNQETHMKTSKKTIVLNKHRKNKEKRNFTNTNKQNATHASLIFHYFIYYQLIRLYQKTYNNLLAITQL